mmetsp:Transcript_137917/g.384613  ORF Transcript_137917/g.384613 Transcript_137917/m.384613 type:complete len:209 (+) Transcript_137917:99-725(+)
MPTGSVATVASTSDGIAEQGPKTIACATLPYCHRWWLSASASFEILAALLLAVVLLVLAAVLVGIACAGLTLACRSCWLLTGRSYFLRQSNDSRGDYEPVSYPDPDIGNCVKARTLEAGRGTAASRPWMGALAWCCCGAALSLAAVACGGAVWLRWGGDLPHTWVLPNLENSTNATAFGKSRRSSPPQLQAVLAAGMTAGTSRPEAVA